MNEQAFDLLNAALGLTIIMNLTLVAAERQMQRLRFLAFQGMVLGLTPLLAFAHDPSTDIIIASMVFFTVKGFVLPYILLRTHRSLAHSTSVPPYLSGAVCVFAVLAGFALSLWLNARLGVSANPLFNTMFPTAFTTIISGLLLIVTRKKALTQVFGYLTLENGIFLLGVPMVHVDAIWLELTILIDIFVGALVMGMAIRHLQAEFGAISVDQFSTLKG